MRCINCGIENEENNKFCINCGSKLQMSDKKNNKMPTLSIVALIFFIAQFLSFPLKFILGKFVLNMPYTLISLIFAIISRIKNNDKVSLVIIIVDYVIISLSIIFMIILFFFAAYLFKTALGSLDGCSNMG